MEPLVDSEKAQEFLNVSRRTLERWLARKQIPARKYGRRWRFNLQELEEFGKKNGSSGLGQRGRVNQYDWGKEMKFPWNANKLLRGQGGKVSCPAKGRPFQGPAEPPVVLWHGKPTNWERTPEDRQWIGRSLCPDTIPQWSQPGFICASSPHIRMAKEGGWDYFKPIGYFNLPCKTKHLPGSGWISKNEYYC